MDSVVACIYGVDHGLRGRREMLRLAEDGQGIREST